MPRADKLVLILTKLNSLPSLESRFEVAKLTKTCGVYDYVFIHLIIWNTFGRRYEYEVQIMHIASSSESMNDMTAKWSEVNTQAIVELLVMNQCPSRYLAHTTGYSHSLLICLTRLLLLYLLHE